MFAIQCVAKLMQDNDIIYFYKFIFFLFEKMDLNTLKLTYINTHYNF